MAKKSNAKRSKSGAKTPRGASRPGSPIPAADDSAAGREGEQAADIEVEEEAMKGNVDEEAEQESVAGTDAAAATEAERTDEVEVVREEEMSMPTRVNGTTGNGDNPTMNGLGQNSERSQVQTDEVPAADGVDDADKAIDATTPVVQDALAGDDETSAPVEIQDDGLRSSVDDEGSADTEEIPSGVEQAEGDTVDEQEEAHEIVPAVHPTPSDPGSESDDENEDPEDDQTRIQTLETDLAQTLREKEHLSTQYRTLLGKLQQMRNSLGEKLKEDAVSRSTRFGVGTAGERRWEQESERGG